MKISLVVPCYNEEDAAPLFLQTVTPILDLTGLCKLMRWPGAGTQE